MWDPLPRSRWQSLLLCRYRLAHWLPSNGPQAIWGWGLPVAVARSRPLWSAAGVEGGGEDSVGEKYSCIFDRDISNIIAVVLMQFHQNVLTCTHLHVRELIIVSELSHLQPPCGGRGYMCSLMGGGDTCREEMCSSHDNIHILKIILGYS